VHVHAPLGVCSGVQASSGSVVHDVRKGVPLAGLVDFRGNGVGCFSLFSVTPFPLSRLLVFRGSGVGCSTSLRLVSLADFRGNGEGCFVSFLCVSFPLSSAPRIDGVDCLASLRSTPLGWRVDLLNFFESFSVEIDLFAVVGDFFNNPRSLDGSYRFLGTLCWVGWLLIATFVGNVGIVGRYVLPGRRMSDYYMSLDTTLAV